MSITTKESKNCIIVELKGELGYPELDAITQAFNSVIDKPNNLVVDMHGLSFISSIIIREIVRVWKFVNSKSLGVVFIGMNKDIKEIFKTTGLTSLIRIEDISAEQAVKIFAKG